MVANKNDSFTAKCLFARANVTTCTQFVIREKKTALLLNNIDFTSGLAWIRKNNSNSMRVYLHIEIIKSDELLLYQLSICTVFDSDKLKSYEWIYKNKKKEALDVWKKSRKRVDCVHAAHKIYFAFIRHTHKNCTSSSYLDDYVVVFLFYFF